MGVKYNRSYFWISIFIIIVGRDARSSLVIPREPLWRHMIVMETWLFVKALNPWWRHQMETFSMLMVFPEGNPSVTGGFPSPWPVTRSFVVFFHAPGQKTVQQTHMRWWWFETPWGSLWRRRNERKHQRSTLLFLPPVRRKSTPCLGIFGAPRYFSPAPNSWISGD